MVANRTTTWVVLMSATALSLVSIGLRISQWPLDRIIYAGLGFAAIAGFCGLLCIPRRY